MANAFRATASRLSRRFLSRFSQHLEAEEASAESATRNWKAISLAVAVPVCSYLFYKHVIVPDEHGHEKEFTPWPHLRIRNKPFPWGDGDSTLFQSKANVGPQKEDSGIVDSDDGQQKVHWITQWWWDNLTEDFEKREEIRNAHIREMQRRANIYRESKKHGRQDNLHDLMFAEVSHLEVRSSSEEHGVHGY